MAAASAHRALLVALVLLCEQLATRADEEAIGGCDAATGSGIQPASLYATPVTLTSLNFGSGGAGPASTGATARGCARLTTCGTCAAVFGCAWCANAWSQGCVDADSPAAGCACAGSATTAFSLCSAAAAPGEQAARVEAPAGRPACDAAAAGTVVVDVSVAGDGEFLGCAGATGWVGLGGGGGSAVLDPPVMTAVGAVSLPFNDDLGGALTRLDPAPLSVFARADATVTAELVAAGCVMSVESTAVPTGVALSVPAGMSAGESGVSLEGPMNAVNQALQAVDLGCYCIGASGVTSISSSATSAGVTRTASIPLVVGTVTQVTSVRGVVKDFLTDSPVAGASVQLSYIGLHSGATAADAANCVIGTATTASDGTWTVSSPSEYLIGGHIISLVAWDLGSAGLNSVQTGFAATVSGSATAPEVFISPWSASTTGTVLGVVTAAATKETMGGALVQLQRIVDPLSSPIAATSTISNAQGDFAFSAVQSGAYQLSVSRAFASLLVQSVVVTSGATVSLLAPLVSELAGGNHFRAVLQWRANVIDLDARIEATGCSGGAGAVAVTTGAASGCDAGHAIRLEAADTADVVAGSGSESILVENTTADGTYLVSVAAASASVFSITTNAVVRVYTQSRLLSELHVPEGFHSGNVWNAFCWDATDNSVHVIGSIDAQAFTCTAGCSCS